MHESGSEPGIVALQDAVHTASPSDTILESSPNGDIQLNGAAENAVRSRRNGTYVENVVEDRLKSLMDIKHVLLPWLEMHASGMGTRCNTLGGTKVRVGWMMPMDNHMMNKLESVHPFGVFCGYRTTERARGSHPQGCRGSAHETQIV